MILVGLGCQIDPMMPLKMVVVSYHVSNPSSTKCQEREVASLTNQHEGRCIRRSWKPKMAYVHKIL